MIYADFNGSYPIRDSVKKYLTKRLDGPFGNPNSIHSLGKDLKNGLDQCRKIIATSINAQSHQIIFNSGASEGISQLFNSLLIGKKGIILTSDLEHSAVHQALEFYSKQGFKILKTPVFKNGKIDLEYIKKLLNDSSLDVSLACFMAVNNETGVIQPYEEIASICNEKDIPYLCDTTQLIGKLPFSFKDSNLQYAICSSHKLGALPGSGFIMAKNPESLTPYIFGGGQESAIRGGTQNYIAIETMAVVFSELNSDLSKMDLLKTIQNEFEANISKEIPSSVIICEESSRIPGTTLLAIPGIHGQATQIELESRNIFVTTSSACSDNEPETSKTLQAMGVNDSIGRSVIRISISVGHEESYPEILDSLIKSYESLSKIKYAN